MKTYNIVIDSNVLVSALLSKNGASFKLIELIGLSDKFIMNISVNLFFEYEAIAKRETKLTSNDIDKLLLYLFKNSNKHNIFSSIRSFLVDSKDDFVLDLAIHSNSEFIVTYNKKHYINIEKFGIKAVTAKEFLEIIGEIK